MTYIQRISSDSLELKRYTNKYSSLKGSVLFFCFKKG